MSKNKPTPVARIQKLVSQINAIVRDMSRKPRTSKNEWRELLESERQTESAKRLLDLSLQLAIAARARLF